MATDRQFRRMRQSGTWILAAVIIVVASLAIIAALFGRFSPPSYPPFFFFFGWGIFVPLFFFGFFFFFRSWGYRWWDSSAYYDPALETLRQRFARGEVTKEQYEQIRKDLASSR
jgi:uncharacterized membrane protein